MAKKRCYERRSPAPGNRPATQHEFRMNPLVPLSILFLLPLSAIAAVLYTDEGVAPDLGYAAIKAAVILIVLGGALSFAASRFAERSDS